MLANEIINIIERVAPLSGQEGWDNSGLQVGSRETQVANVLLCTDVSLAVVKEAIENDCQMIISHHPLLFRGLKRIEGQTWQEKCVIEAIRHNLVIYSSHTAMDVVLGGVSGRMAQKLGIRDYAILSPTGEQNNKETIGLGVIGNLPQRVSLTDFLQQVKQAFCVPVIKYVARESDTTVERVAMCGGAGSEFVEEALRQGADAYISADFKYHDFQQVDGRMTVLDIGHFESEQFTKEIFAELLQDKIGVRMAVADRSPIQCYY